MPTPLYLTVDLHAHRWFERDAADAAIWLCLQPHVALTDVAETEAKYAALRDFVDNCGSGDHFDYVLLPEDEASRSDFVPVNLPTDVDLLVRWDADGPLKQPNPNTRSTDMAVVDPDRFNDDNRERYAADTAGGDNAQPAPAAPFAAGYNLSLVSAWEAMAEDPDTDLSDLANQLVLGFWGGTRRRLRATSVTPGDIEFMALQTGDPADEAEAAADPSFRVTNLHSLNGLMFKVLARDELPDLGNVRDLEIELAWASGSRSLKISEQAPQGLARLQAFFRTLADVPGDVLDELSSRDAPGFRSRVYVDDQMIGFGPVQLGSGVGGCSQTWHRRRAERRADETFQSNLADLSRAVVHFGRAADTAADANRPPVEGDLVFEVADVLECRLLRYRLGGALEAGAWLVARLMPGETDRAQFEAELQADRHCFRDKPLLDTNGNRLADDDVRYLGCYAFPWEDDTLLPLFLVRAEASGDSGIIGARETVSVLLQRFQADRTPVRVTLSPAGARSKDESMIDATGPRWELAPNVQLPAVAFEMFRLVAPALPPELQSRLVLAAAFRDDAEFVFANSAARYEGVVRVDYPTTRGEEAERELREDLVNFNTLNVYHRWPALDQALSQTEEAVERPTLNTRFSELFPFWSRQAEPHAVATAFQFLFRQPVQSPPGDLVGAEIRQYFDALYGAAGTQRAIDFRLEHTYGSEIDLGTDLTLPCPIDIRPMLPPHVASLRFSDETAPEIDAPPFFTVRFTNTSGVETLRLGFDHRYLNPALAPQRTAGEPERVSASREAHIGSIRALCELAYAADIHLEGRFLIFEFTRALQAATSPIIAGLTPLAAFEAPASGWPIHLNDPLRPAAQNLQRLARALLEDWQTTPAFIEIPLPVGAHPPIADSCNVIELILKLRRPARTVPAKDASRWTVVRQVIRPTRLTWTGPEMESAAGVEQGFARFLEQLHEGRAAVQPDQDTRAASGKLLGLLSEGEATSVAAWIVPQGLQRLDDRRIVASLTPLSFLPLALHGQLGVLTFELTKRYLKALGTVLSLAPAAWTPRGSDDDVRQGWQAFLARLEANGAAIGNLVERLQQLLQPVHLAEGNPGDEVPDEEVGRAIRDLTGATSTARAVAEAARAMLLDDPSLFGEAKAMLYTRLRDQQRLGPITPAFHDWVTTRLSAAGKFRDHRRLTYRDGLTTLAGEAGFGFLEVLLDSGYGSDFTLQSAQALSFESLIEPFEPRQTEGRERDPTIPLDGNRVRLPNRSVENLRVFLPSRQPIRDPVLASAEFFDAIQEDPDWSRELREPDRMFDMQRLLAGSISPATTQPRVSVRAASPAASRSPALDDFLVSAVFQVWSDEEDEFSADEFQVWIDDVVEADPATRDAAVVEQRLSEAFLKQLYKLQDAPQIEGLADLDDVIGFAEEAQELIRPAGVLGPAEWDETPTLRLSVEGAVGQEVLSRVDVISSPDDYLEAFLMRVEPHDPDAAPRPRPHYLLLAAERPIWRRTSIRLGQTRNRRDITGPDFAPVFGFAARSRTSAVTQQYAISREVDAAISLPGRELTWRQIEAALVVQQILLPSALRRTHHLAVALFHEQRGQLAQGFFDDAGRARQDEVSEFLSKFPLEVMSVAPEAAETTVIRFPEPYVDFVMDLQWFSSRNRELFRIAGIRVSFDSS